MLVEDIFSKVEKLHVQVGVVMTIASCDKLIKLSCNLLKVQTAIDIAERVYQSGLVLPIDSFHPILHACERCNEFDLVHQVYSMICNHDVIPVADTFRNMMILHAKMKDYEGAYNLLNDARMMNVMPTAGMYNAIMVGYIREKNSIGVLTVLRQMEDADIEPDSETYSYLISNCGNEKDIEKYHDEMQRSGVRPTKYIYAALIHAYANFGKIEMAKQVLKDSGIPSRHLKEIRSVLVSALCSNGQISDALHQYDEIKQAGGMLEPKACMVLIDHLRTEGNFDRLEQLLRELSNSNYWFDGCGRVIQYCVRHNLLSSAIELLAKLKEKDESSTYIIIDKVFHEIWAMEPINLETGLELLQAIKEKLHLFITRISLDFLLSTCVKAKDPIRAKLIWSEYEHAGLPYNALTYSRMYQALSAGGDHEAASKIMKEIPKDDPHICYVIESIKATYGKISKNNSKKKGFLSFLD
ncbi:Pentatricopeptide repeat-containing protein [Apostasia shenzhenica]|uniref:Pentatricopeptide repeat-containing protein n=1 Tax=Apostasia shenzhenica TaxID=1088818 RepID=A0A2I0B330_9ASPA|nr:Pentatricopeptide repeat-containing protein [Apostasia shenzhenica]